MQIPKMFKRPYDDNSGKIVQAINSLQSTVRRSFETLFGVTHGGARDLKKVFGWPTEAERTYGYYYNLYRYQDYATRVINCFPRSCWRAGAALKPSEESNEILLEAEMKTLKKAGMFVGLERADILNRIGSFSVLYVSIPGQNPREPVSGGVGKNKLKDVAFAPYPEPSIAVSEYDSDESSSRYGLPKLYTLTPGQSQASQTKLEDIRNPIEVHWTRVVHMAEGALGNSIYGIPELENIANRLVDLNKTIGSSAEGFFRNADPKKTLDIDKETKVTPEEFAALNDDAEDWVNDWKTFFGIKGGKVRAIPVQNMDPEPTVRVALQSISGAKGIPIRILTGEGAGQLAGNEDKASYNQNVSDRQNQTCEGWLTTALGIVEMAGMLKVPDNAIVCWPLPEAMDELTKSQVALNEAKTAEALTSAITTYAVTPGADLVISPMAFMALIVKVDMEAIQQVEEDLKALGGAGDGD